MSHDDIRQRLAAVENIDWSKVESGGQAEYFGDWLHVGPVMLMTTLTPEPEDLADVAQTQAVATFVQHAAADLRRLLTDLDHATTTREAVMPSNPVYGPPPDPERGEPARYLADVVEVQRPTGEVVVMDLVALADAAINAERAVAGLRGEVAELRLRVAALEAQAKRTEQAGRMLAGGSREEGDG
jgi:hypothetical protein